MLQGVCQTRGGRQTGFGVIFRRFPQDQGKVLY